MKQPFEAFGCTYATCNNGDGFRYIEWLEHLNLETRFNWGQCGGSLQWREWLNGLNGYARTSLQPALSPIHRGMTTESPDPSPECLRSWTMPLSWGCRLRADPCVSPGVLCAEENGVLHLAFYKQSPFYMLAAASGQCTARLLLEAKNTLSIRIVTTLVAILDGWDGRCQCPLYS